MVSFTGITYTDDVTNFVVDSDGSVSIAKNGVTDVVGSVVLYRIKSSDKGQPISTGVGTIHQGYLKTIKSR